MNAEWYRIIVGNPDPRQKVRSMGDQALSEAVAEIEAMSHPNDFHRAVYGMLFGEVLLRWRAVAGVANEGRRPTEYAENTEGEG